MIRPFTTPFLALAALALTLPLAACATSSVEDDVVAASEDELRVLTASEVVGTIAFGETKRVRYEPVPRYRALSFDAAAGDEVEIWVRGLGGADARAFLLNAAYATVASNDDASSGTRDARIAKKLDAAGKYYIAIREMDEETSPISDFDVSLTKTNAPPPPPPPPPVSGSPFDPASCSGAALAHASIVSMFPPGTVGTKTFPGTVHARMRTCTELGGCSPWQETKDVYPQHRWHGCSQQQKRCASDKGNLLVTFANTSSPFSVGLEMKTADFPNLADKATVPYDGNGRISLGNPWSVGNSGSGLNMETRYGAHEALGVPFQVDVRESCFRGISKQSHRQGPQLHTELEIVVMGQIDGT